jgi:thioredoxin 1
MRPIDSNQEDLENDLQEKGITLVDFWAPWCLPCRMIFPMLEEIGEDLPNIKILRINIDENIEVAEDYKIQSIPTIFIFKDKLLVDRTIGALSKIKFLSILTFYL